MSARLLDSAVRLLGLVMIGTIICFLVTPILVTALMAFDARPYLGPLPPPALSFRCSHSSSPTITSCVA